MDDSSQDSKQRPFLLFTEDDGETVEPGNDPLSARAVSSLSPPPLMHSMIPESESSSTTSSSMVFSSDEEYEDSQRSGQPLLGPPQDAMDSNANFIGALNTEEMRGVLDVMGKRSRVHGVLCDTDESLLMIAGHHPWDVNCLFLRILSFCGMPELCAMMSVNRCFYAVVTDDALWKGLLYGFNLQPLLSHPTGPRSNFYRYFVDEIITARALHGHYYFEAATWPNLLDNGTRPVGEDGSGKSMGGGSPKNALQQRFFAQQQEDELIFPVEAITMLLSSASLGQMNHAIGRVQLYVEYKDKATEMIQGAARFCLHRGCFIFSCASFGSNTRGPVFTVAIKTVHKRWANQSYQQFARHLDGIQLVMTPALLEGQTQGSRITERDIISVSRPPVYKIQ